MLVQYYQNRLIVVGKLWCGENGSYIYKLNHKDAKFLYDIFEEPQLIRIWVSKFAGDFQIMDDFQLEVFEKTKEFEHEDSWLLVEV